MDFEETEAEIQKMNEGLKRKEDQFLTKKTQLQAVIMQRNQEAMANKFLDHECEILQKQLEMLDEVIEEEFKSITKMLGNRPKNKIERAMKKFEQHRICFEKSLDKIDYIGKMGPLLLDESALDDELKTATNQLKSLEQSCQEKNGEIQKRFKRRPKYMEIEDDTRMLAGILYELTEIKKEEEEMVTKRSQYNSDLSAKVLKMKNVIAKSKKKHF